MNGFVSRFKPTYVRAIVYMLQASEYHIGDYLKWLHRTSDFDRVMKRKGLVMTNKAMLLIAYVSGLVILSIVSAILLIVSGGISIVLGALVLLALPWILAYAVLIPLWFGSVFIQGPKEKAIIERARAKVAAHPARKIAIAGSFGKTSAKEVLATVLSEGKKVAATPGNMNTVIGTSRFIESLEGDEDILIFEFGESHVGDIRELCELARPDMGIITGINAAHLSSFGTIENTIATIFELKDFLGTKRLYKNKESKLVRENIDDEDAFAYDRSGVNGWSVSDVKISLKKGTEFSAEKKSQVIWAKTALIGEHNLGILAATIDVADSLGLSASEIADGLKRVVPFKHRMEPRELYGAWVIDDTYNGNVEGVEAGLALLKYAKGDRKVYVTPGLVEQGSETENIHEHIGESIAEVADVVFLMKNSVTDFIKTGLKKAEYKGQLVVIDEPLDFYTNLDHFIAAGDVVLMQNDWTDNYA